MVCDRCIMVVKSELEKFGLHPNTVELGEADLTEELSPDQKVELDLRFRELGFELIDDRKTRTIESIKTSVLEWVHYSEAPLKMTFSEYLTDKFHHDYSSLSKLFSEVQGVTIEHYVITQKIERVKELLVYDELSLSEIAHQLHYSSVSHLSKQFKKVTGLTPTHFKKVRENKRIPLDKLLD